MGDLERALAFADQIQTFAGRTGVVAWKIVEILRLTHRGFPVTAINKLIPDYTIRVYKTRGLYYMKWDDSVDRFFLPIWPH